MNGENKQAQPVNDSGWQFDPGTQNAATPVTPTNSTAVLESTSPAPQQAPAPNDQPVTDEMPSALPPMTADQNVAVDQLLPSGPEVSWSASEFIAHDKGTMWYIILLVSTVVIAAIVFLITRDIVSLVAVIGALAAFGYMAKRKPQTISYHIGPEGLTANNRTYGFSNFKSFGLQDEGAFASLVFMPMKRFMLPLYIYFPPEEHDEIVGTLSHYVPYSPIQSGLIERTSHRIRF